MPAHPDEDFLEFVLDQPIADVDVVGERVTAGERTIKSHFFFKPSMCCVDGPFAGSRVAAARVRPETS